MHKAGRSGKPPALFFFFPFPFSVPALTRERVRDTQPRPPRRRHSFRGPSGPGSASESRPQVFDAELLLLLPLTAPSSRSLRRGASSHQGVTNTPSLRGTEHLRQAELGPEGATPQSVPTQSNHLPPTRPQSFRPLNPVRSPALPGRHLPNTSLATSEGNSMIRTAQGAA